MNETFDQVQLTQILYEISMSIGDSIELRSMLKTSLSTILKKLNCVSGGIFQKREEQPGIYQLEAVYTIPRRPDRDKTYQEAVLRLPQTVNDANYNDFLTSLPLVEEGQDGNFYHIFELPNFGTLLLIKNSEQLNTHLIKSLRPLLGKLASASLASTSDAKLRQNEERYRLFIEATLDGIIVHDGPVIKEINQALAETIQYAPEELVGTNIYNILDPTCHDLATDRALKLSKTPYELLAVRKDGVLVPVEVTDKEFIEDGTTYRVTAVRDLSHQKRLETELSSLVERRTRQVEISVQITQDIAEATDLASLYQRIVTEIKDQLGYYHTQMLRYNPDLDAVELISGYGDIGKQMLADKHPLPLGEGIIGTAVATGESVLRPNLLDDPDWTPNPLLPETKGEIAVPIKLDNEILGVLDVQSDTPDALTNNDQLLLEGLCGQIAVAIKTTRLTEEHRQIEKALQNSQETLQSTLKRQQALHDVNLELSSIQDPDELYRQVILKAQEHLGFDRIGLYLLDFETDELSGTFGIDTQGEMVSIKDDKFSFTEGDWVRDFVYNEERLLVNENAELLDAQEVIGHGWHLVAAMWIRDTPIGVIFADNLISQQPFEPHLPELLSAYSTIVANLITRLQADDALQQSQETLQETLARQQSLHDINLDLSSIQDLDELYQQIIIKAHEDLGFDRIGLYLVDLEAEHLYGTYGISINGQLQSDKDDIIHFSEGDWVKNFIFNEKQLLVEEDVDLWEGQDVIGHGWKVNATLWVRDTPIGAFFADNLISQQPLQSYIPELLSAYSTNVANLIDRLQADDTLQQSQKTLQETLTQQKTLHDVNLDLSSIQDLDELYQQIIIKAREDLGFDRIGLFLVDMDLEELSGTYGIDPKGKLRSIKQDIFDFSSGDWVRNIVHSQERIFVREDIDLLEGQEVIGRGWHLTATMKIRDTLIGVMFADNLVSKQPFQPHLPELLAAYSTDAANLINRMRAEQNLRNRETTIQDFLVKQQELHEISIQLSTHNTLEDLFQEAILLSQSKLGFGRIGLYLYDSDKDILHGTYGIGTDGKLRKEYHLVHKIADEPWMQKFLYHRERLDVNEDAPLYEDGVVVGQGWNVTAALWQAGQPIGLLFADNLLDQKPLETYQPELLTAFGATVGNQIRRIEDELQRRKAEEAVAHQAAELQTVADLSTQITSIQNPQELMETIVKETQKQFNLYHCHIFLMDEGERNLRIQACGWHPDAEEYDTHGDSVIALDAKQSLVAQAARSKQPVVINDVVNDPNWLPNELLPDTRSELAVPMIIGDTVIGVFDVQSSEVNRFDTEDVQVQVTLASQTVVALENARSLARSEEVIAEMDELTRRLTRESWEEYLTDLEEKDTGIVYHDGEFKPVDSEIPEADTQETAVTTNGHLSQSLMVHGETIGHLTAFNDEDMTEIDSDAAIIMAAIAEQLSARVENIRLTEQTQQALAVTQDQAQRLGLLNEISAEMSNVERLDQVFEIIFKRIPTLLNVDRVSLIMLRPDKESLEIIGYEGEEMDAPTGTIIPLAGTIMEQAINENQVLSTEASSSESTILSSMVAPLFTAGRAIGTLNIGSKKANALTDRERTLMQQLATMLSSVIENKRLLAAAQAHAERERQVRTITDKIRRGADRESILNIAQEEISKLIGAKQTKAQLGTKAQLLERIQQTMEQPKKES